MLGDVDLKAFFEYYGCEVVDKESHRFREHDHRYHSLVLEINGDKERFNDACDRLLQVTYQTHVLIRGISEDRGVIHLFPYKTVNKLLQIATKLKATIETSPRYLKNAPHAIAGHEKVVGFIYALHAVKQSDSANELMKAFRSAFEYYDAILAQHEKMTDSGMALISPEEMEVILAIEPIE